MELTSEEKVVAGLVHLALLLNVIGLVASVVVYMLYRPKSTFVARHAKQSLGLQVISLILSATIPVAFGASAVGLFSLGAKRATLGTGAAGALLLWITGVTMLVMAVIAAVRAFQGHEHVHPVFGKWVDSLAQ